MLTVSDQIKGNETTVMLTVEFPAKPSVVRFIKFGTEDEANHFVNESDGKMTLGGRAQFTARVLPDIEVEISDGVQQEIDSLFLM